MKLKNVVLVVFVLLLFSTVVVVRFVTPVTAGLSVHNVDSGLDYATIQEAVDAPETLPGHTIFVSSGVYYETVVLTKELSLIGEDKNTTVIDANEQGSVISIKNVNYSRVSGFTLQNGGRCFSNLPLPDKAGIYVANSQGVIVDQNVIKRTENGIYIVNSNGIVVYDNILTPNDDSDIYLFKSNNTIISENSITQSMGTSSILLKFSVHNIIDKNTISLGPGNAITLDNSHENIVEHNWLTGKSWDGIDVWYSSYNLIVGNTIVGNWRGLVLDDARENTFYHNSLISNGEGPGGELKQVVFYGINTGNSWNDGLGKGNYWSDYNGLDLNNDSIGDTPYVIDETNQDDYPLMNPYIIPPEKLQNLYYELLFNYDSLQTSYDDLNARTRNELNIVRSLMYVFMITTIILLAITVYFATRKPKALPTSISEV